jgi:hypothetical protein
MYIKNMQTHFPQNPICQQIANGYPCMMRIHTNPEYRMMMIPDTHLTQALVQIKIKTSF